jgi:hypothetical protein
MRHRLSTHLRTFAAGLALAVAIGGASTALAATSPRKAFHPSPAKTAGSLARQRPSGGRLVYPIGNEISNATTLTPAGRVTTINGSVTTAPSELDEVYGVFLIAGEVVDLSMSAGATTDYGLAVFDDSATSVWDDALELVLPSYYGGPVSYPAAISFKAPYSGYYYLDVYTWVDDSGDNGGSGAYSMDVTFTRSATMMQLAPVANLAFGSTTSVSGAVTGRQAFGETVTGDVLLSLSYDGVIYLPWRSTSLDSEGHFSFTGLSPVAKVYYLAHYEGTAAFSPSAGHTTVNTTALLSAVASRRYGARSYTLSGTLEPWHQAGTSAVRIYLWKYVSGHYKAMGYRAAKLSDLSYYSRFSTNYKFPSTGKWRLQAYHSDSDHLKTTSAYTYVTVK